MFFKPKDDKESMTRAEKMYGAGINRGLAGFVVPKKKKSKNSQEVDQPAVGAVPVITTEQIPETNYRIIGAVSGEGVDFAAALKQVRVSAHQQGAGAVVALRVAEHGDKLLAYGTAVRLVD